MNNARGAAMLSGLKGGERVTMRAPNGETVTGRARLNTAGAPLLILPGRFYILTADTILKVNHG